MDIVLFTLHIVAPIFLLILVGILLKRLGIINEVFVSHTSKFVFQISLPSLIFLKIATVKITEAFDGQLILTALILVLIFAVFSWFSSTIFTNVPTNRGVFAQGSFRSNFAIIGLALIANLIGEDQLGKASLVLAFVMPLYNILAVIVLTLPLKMERKFNYFKMLKEIIKNPLIIAALIASPFSIFQIDFGQIFNTTLTYLARIALPLALVGIGASLNLKSLKSASKISFAVTFNKIVLFPLFGVIAGVLLNFDSNQMVIIYILFASPTAVASFVMADAMGSNSKLAGDIIVISTLFSIVTLSIGIIILKYYTLI